MVFRDLKRVICCSLKMKEIPLKNIHQSQKANLYNMYKFLTKKSKLCLDFLLIWRNQYCMNRLCIPSWPLFLPTQNSRRYPRSFSEPPPCEPLTDPHPGAACSGPSHAPLLEASLAASSPVIYLQEQHSSGARLDQMAVISQTEAQRWEFWPILWSAARSNRCRSE